MAKKKTSIYCPSRQLTTLTENQNVITDLFINVFRAIKIAKAGGFSVTVIYDYEKGASDYNLIKNYCKGWFDNWSDNGDIYVELRSIGDTIGSYIFDTKENIDARINSTKDKETKFVLSDGSKQLIKMGQNRLNLSLTQLDTINKIALVIAKLNNSDETDIIHFAEAIQYQSREDSYIIAETEQKYVTFGSVQIKTVCPNEFDIKEAIDYLTSLLK